MIRLGQPTDLPWRILPLALLALGSATVIGWAVRERAYWDTVAGALPDAADAGHHSVSNGGIGLPPAILREPVANFAGITLLAAHLTFAGVLIAAAITRRRKRAGRVGSALTFAMISALLAGVTTLAVAALSVGNAISVGNTLAAAVTVLQYTFALTLVVTIVADLRPAGPVTWERPSPC